MAQNGAKEEEWLKEQNDIKSRVVCNDTHLPFGIPSVSTRCVGSIPRHHPLLSDTNENEELGLGNLRWIGGVDISFFSNSDERACAALVVWDAQTGRAEYIRCREVKMSEPYIPGFLAFRELEHFKYLLHELRNTHPDIFPQVVLVDGNGILHPRKAGSATCLGVICGLPTVGVAKKLFQIDSLVETDCRREVSHFCENPGDYLALYDDSGELLGAAVIAAAGSSRPIFVSVGHGLSLSTSIKIVKLCAEHRIPQPIRIADLASRAFIRNGESGN